MKKYLATLFSILLLVPVFAFAETTKPVCPTLGQGFSRGAQGSGVKELQQFLSDHFNVPQSDVVTGFFGPKTQELVQKFQGEQGLEQAGNVGPKTRAAIRGMCEGKKPKDSNGKDSFITKRLTCNIHASPISIQPNQPVTFTWSSTNADYAVWGSGDKESANGSTTFTNIGTTTTFSLTFFGANGSVTCNLRVNVGATENTDQTLVKPPVTAVCPLIGWMQPTSPCDGAWQPRYSDGGCQIGWQCLGKPKDPEKVCPQVLPACTNPEVSLGADGCKVYRCPNITPTSTPPKPPVVCPQVLPACSEPQVMLSPDGCTIYKCPLPISTTTPPRLPIACPAIWTQPLEPCQFGTAPKYDVNGCQIGVQCLQSSAAGSGNTSCTTPWGAKVISDGQTVPYEPYFSLGRLSKSVVIPLMKCSAGLWQLCDWQGNNCRPWAPLTLQLHSYAPASAYSATELAAAFSGLQSLMQGVLTVFGK